MLSKLAFSNVRKSVRDFGVYFLTVLLGVAVFYAFNSMSAQRGVLAFSESGDRMFELLGTVISGVSVFIAFVLVFLVVYANRFLIRRRKREFGLYLALGMGTGDVVKVVLLESAVVGAASLAAGLAAGVGISQLLLYFTSLMFQADVAGSSGFAFVFSVEALVKTILVFGAIFVLAGLLNARTVSHARLIDLMHAESVNEEMKLRSLPLSLALFLVSLVLIGISYKLLIDNGLLSPSPEFAAATVLVCIGTVLFFYSLSGFLLKLMQLIRPVYLRGLNMFTLRQLNAKVNTTFVALSIVCLTLFLAITSVCGGVGIRNTIEGNLENSTAYSASVRTSFANYSTEDGITPFDLGTFGAYAASVNYDMAEGLRASAQTIGAGDFDAVVESAAQIDLMVDGEDPLTVGAVEDATNLDLGTSNREINPDYRELPLYLASLSQVNHALELAGKDKIELGEGECAILSDSDITLDFMKGVVDRRPTFDVGGVELTAARFSDECLETTSFPMNTGTVIVPDEAMPATAQRMYSVLDVQCETEEDERAFQALCDAVDVSEGPDTWPVTMAQSRTLVAEQSLGLSAVVAYLAIYLGFVLVIACASILAIQQLSDASDNARRYSLLRKLGAPRGMINAALFAQVLIYFLFPLMLALAHAACAMQVVADVVAVFGHLDITAMAATVTVAFLATYGVYFIVTYFGAKRMIGGESGLNRKG